MLLIKNIIYIFIRSQGAETGPPLGTVLGNLGINSTKFCKDFNDFTKDLPGYFLLKVKIIIFEDRSFNFFIFLPTTGFILSFLKVSLKIEGFNQNLKKNVVYLKDVIELAKFKFPNLNLANSIPIILGSVQSSSLLVLK